MDFYSYLWLRLDGSPYYVGKGKGDRAFTSRKHEVHCPDNRARILVFPMAREAEAFESEIALIELFGRKDLGTGCLRNLTDGGDGPSGWVPSEESRRRMMVAAKARKGRFSHSADTRKKIAASHLANWANPKYRAEHPNSGHAQTPAQRQARYRERLAAKSSN